MFLVLYCQNYKKLRSSQGNLTFSACHPMKVLTKTALVFTAGYCDTATFVHMDEIFSAHVTGNFVIFALALAKGVETHDYLKIATFPVFVLAVIIGTLLYHLGQQKKETDNSHRLIWAMSALLVICAIISSTCYLLRGTSDLGWLDILVTMLLVLAMGIQNSIHHFLPGPLTTVMTGTVMNTTASFTEIHLLRLEPMAQNKPVRSLFSPFRKMVFFAFGCVLSAFFTLQVGLSSIVVPAVIMLGIMVLEKTSPAAEILPGQE